MKIKKMIKGRLILFQEERIRMVDEQGKSFLFDLSHGVSVKSEDLTNWINAKTPLTVSYEGEPETESGVAYSIKEAA